MECVTIYNKKLSREEIPDGMCYNNKKLGRDEIPDGMCYNI